VTNSAKASDPSAVERPADELVAGTRIAARDRGLTRREDEVLVLVARGLRDDEIASQLGIAATSVATLLRSAMGKLDAPTRTRAARQLTAKD
jgi:DNA-binding CsgD family transcriptional regulator